MKNSERTFRKKFASTRSKRVVEVLKLIAKGYTSNKIASVTKVPRTSVTTIRGNYTRGYYAPWVYPGTNSKASGLCKY